MEVHEEIKISELIKVFFNRINVILYSVLICIFFSLIYILATPKIYISETIIEFPVNNVSVLEGDRLLKNYGPEGIRDFYTSSKNIENAKNIYESDYKKIIETNNLEKKITVKISGLNREFLSASIKSKDKTFAKDFLVSLNKSYIDKFQIDSALAYKFISNEIPKVKQKLSEAEENLAKYKLEKSDINFYSSEANFRLIEGITQQINALKIRELEIKEFYKVSHPLYQTLLTQIDMLEKEQINIQQNLNNLTLDELKLNSLENQITIYQNALDNLISRQIELSLDTASKENSLRIILEPSNPSILYKEKFLHSFFLSFIIQVLIFIGILLEHSFSRRILGPDDLKKIIQFNDNYLGEVAYNSAKDISKMDKYISDEILKKTVFAFKEKIQKNSITTVIGLEIGAGKTHISLELFKSLSEIGHSVCLVDTDFRKKTASSLFFEKTKIPATLEEFIEKEEEFKINNSLVVTAPEVKDSALYLSSSNFQEYLKNLKARFDYVIIDTPSWDLFVDAKIISNFSDSTIYAAKFEHSKVAKISQLIESDFKNNKNLYFILNELKLYKKILNYNYKYAKYYYGYDAYSSYFGIKKYKSKLDKFFKNKKNLFKK